MPDKRPDMDFRLDCGCNMVWVDDGSVPDDNPPKPGDKVPCALKDHGETSTVIWTQADGEEVYNTAERVALFESLQKDTAEKMEHLARVYGVGINPSDQASLRMETLIDFLLPQSTPARLEFSINYQQAFIKRLERMRADLSRQRLQLPSSGSNGFRPLKGL